MGAMQVKRVRMEKPRTHKRKWEHWDGGERPGKFLCTGIQAVRAQLLAVGAHGVGLVDTQSALLGDLVGFANTSLFVASAQTQGVKWYSDDNCDGTVMVL